MQYAKGFLHSPWQDIYAMNVSVYIQIRNQLASSCVSPKDDVIAHNASLKG